MLTGFIPLWSLYVLGECNHNLLLHCKTSCVQVDKIDLKTVLKGKVISNRERGHPLLRVHVHVVLHRESAS